MKTVCFILLHYKDAAVTEKCIRSILNLNGAGRAQILIVDNSPGDNGGRLLAQKYSEYQNIRLLSAPQGAGFSRANNTGYRYALSHFDPDFIVAANNDIFFEQPDFIDLLFELYEKEAFSVLGPDIIHTGSGAHQNPLALSLRTAKEAESTIAKNRLALRFFPIVYPILHLCEKLYRPDNRKGPDYTKPAENAVLCGACLIFSRRYMDACQDAFWPETHFFYEEYILACKCGKKQLKTLYSPRLRVLHEGGAATRSSYRQDRERIRFVLQNTLDACQIYRDYL